MRRRGQGKKGKRKTKSKRQIQEDSLKDIYTGKKKKKKVTRDREGKEREGKGGKEGAVSKWGSCGGSGRVAKVVKMGIMVSKTITTCEECRGKGKIIKDKCKLCKGKGVVEDVKVLDIDVEKGVPEGHRYVFKGEADEYVKFIIINSLELRQVM